MEYLSYYGEFNTAHLIKWTALLFCQSVRELLGKGGKRVHSKYLSHFQLITTNLEVVLCVQERDKDNYNRQCRGGPIRCARIQ